MVSLPTGTTEDLRHIIWKHHPVEEICPCIDHFTAKVILGDHQQCENGNFLVHCKIDPNPFGGVWPSDICEAPIPSCQRQHVMQTDFWMKISDESWYKQVSFEKEVLLYNVKNRPWDSTPHVDARGYQSAIMKCNSQTNGDISQFDPISIRCCEFCMGAFSGWSHVIAIMKELGLNIRHEWGIDIDPICCQSASLTHGMQRIQSAQQFFQEKGTNVGEIRPIFQTDIREAWYLQFVTSGDMEMALLSPPCQPWTNAICNPKGLNRKDGQTMAFCWSRVKLIQPKFVAMEMVSNIVCHPHWKIILYLIEWSGYHILSVETLQLSDIIPQSRRRVLLIAVRKGFMTSPESFQWMTWPTGKKHTLRSFGCIVDDPDEFSEYPFLGDDLMKVYLDPKVAPKDMREETQGKSHKDFNRRVRLKTIDECVFPCILANYTKAHHLPSELLHQSGLFGGLLLQGARPRFLTSPEIFVLMGGLVPSWLPSCKEARIHVLGNCIATPHAAITILNIVSLFNNTISRDEIHEMFAKIFSCRIHSRNMAIRISEEGMFIDKSKHDCMEIPATVPMRTFVQITVRSPTECFRFWIEPHVSIVLALQSLVGPSIPSKLEFCIHGQVRVALQMDDTVETCGKQISSAVPCILHFDDAKFTQHDSKLISIMTHEGPVILERNEHENVRSIEQIIKDHFPMKPSQSEEGVRLINALGSDMHGDCPCPDMMLMATPCSYESINQQAFDEIRCIMDMGCITFIAPRFQLNSFLHHLQQIGLEPVLHAVGWMIVLSPQPMDWLAKTKIMILKQPTTLACTTESIQMLIASRFAMSLLPKPQEQTEEHLHIRVKIWQFVMWQGYIQTHLTPHVFIKGWEFACEFLGVELPLRAILHGKSINPEFSFHDIFENVKVTNCNGESIIKMHLLTGLRGGGNKNDELTQAKNSVAVFLLGKGADLQQTSHFADVVTRSMGIVAIQRLMSIPDPDVRMSALQQGAQQFHIKWPHFLRGDAENLKTTKASIAKKEKKFQTTLKAESFKLINDNIVNEDGSTCVIRSDVAPNAAGIVLMDSEQAQKWLQDFKVISQDELAILTLDTNVHLQIRQSVTPYRLVHWVRMDNRQSFVVVSTTLGRNRF